MPTEGPARHAGPVADVVTQDVVTQKKLAEKEAALRDTARRDIAPKEVSFKEITPREIAPKEVAIKDIAYRDSAPRDSAPRDSAPGDSATKASTTSNLAEVDEAQLSALQHLFYPQSFASLSNRSERIKAFGASAFLVAVPVFVQAPLVRAFPWISLAMTGLWLWLGWTLFNQPSKRLWGDLTIGFSWTWLAGAVYWGWFRWEPLIHLPIESIGLPIVLVLMRRGKANIGNYFYLGSLFGTAITDLYFYCTDLIPYWRKLMVSQPTEASQILHSALIQMGTYQGVGFAVVLLSLLVMLGTIPLRTQSVRWWAFSGAVLSTILVDSLFFAAAILA